MDYPPPQTLQVSHLLLHIAGRQCRAYVYKKTLSKKIESVLCVNVY